MSYFSDVELGERPCDRDEIDDKVWGGIRVIIAPVSMTARLARAFLTCAATASGQSDRRTCVLAGDAVRDPKPERIAVGAFWAVPPTLDALDVIQFCWRVIRKPKRVTDEIDVREWLGDPTREMVREESLGLGSYGKILIVLTSTKIGQEFEPNEEDEEQELIESWTPRFKR